MAPVRRLVAALLRWDLHRAFRRVQWVGPEPAALPDGPVIAYANHHHFYDGHLAWLLFRQHLDRPPTLWMAEWDRFPFFAAVGAQPFPPDDPARRAATVRRTARRFRARPRTVLVYYPAGTLHRPEDGIQAFSADAVARLARLYPTATWWPYAVHVTWRNEATPTALLTGGSPHEADGQEHARLRRLWHRLQTPQDRPTTTLLRGHRSMEEWWDFSFASSFFERYL
ncbi:acyltransferase [Salinibacter ruber]|uniref:acyltransferase n=1 Tax=Salinibacter ruber TaxID=146919 RepID=UPI0020733C9C|nr:acyltransferase [Salinibacter ruber]